MNEKQNNENMETWDITINNRIKTPFEMQKFFNDIIKVYEKHNLSISHEDTHGSFIIEKNSQTNIKWLKHAMKNYYIGDDSK